MPKKQNKEKPQEQVVEPTTVNNSVLSSYNPNVIAGIRACVESSQSALLIGETGTGKTTLLNELAKEVGKKLHRVSVNGNMGIDEILGKYLAKDGSTYWVDGILTKAVRNGDWVVFDELNAMLPEMGFALHSLLDDARCITLAEKDGEVVPAHKDFRFFGAMNDSENYAGTKDVNMALMSRFGGVFEIAVFSFAKEVEVLMRNSISGQVANTLCSVANELREMRKNGDILTFTSTRDLIQAGILNQKGVQIEHAMQFAMFNKLNTEEREEVAKNALIAKYIQGTEIYKSAREIELEEKVAVMTKQIAENNKKHEEELKNYRDRINQLEPLAANQNYQLDAKKMEMLKALGVVKGN